MISRKTKKHLLNCLCSQKKYIPKWPRSLMFSADVLTKVKAGTELEAVAEASGLAGLQSDNG